MELIVSSCVLLFFNLNAVLLSFYQKKKIHTDIAISRSCNAWAVFRMVREWLLALNHGNQTDLSTTTMDLSRANNEAITVHRAESHVKVVPNVGERSPWNYYTGIETIMHPFYHEYSIRTTNGWWPYYSDGFPVYILFNFFSKCFNVRVNNLVWAVIMHFRISSASRVYFGSFEGRYKRGYYCRERLYSQISLKVRDSKKNWHFRQDCLWDCMIRYMYSTFSVDLGILVSLYTS